jgi:hypothetical protein
MKTFEKFFKCFKFLEKNTFFRKKKFTLPGFLLFCCAVFRFMHSYTPMLFCCRLCQGQAFAPPLHRRRSACFAGGAKQSFASALRCVAELCGVQSAPPGQSLWHIQGGRKT